MNRVHLVAALVHPWLHRRKVLRWTLPGAALNRLDFLEARLQLNNEYAKLYRALARRCYALGRLP